jgi:hypothetical protein
MSENKERASSDSFSLRLSLFLISAAVIAYQLAIIDLISIIQWHHFSYMIISVALLGFGASGTVLTLFRRYLQSKFHLLYPLLILLSGITMIISFRLTQSEFIAFDSYLVFSDFKHVTRLVITYLLFFIPFFTAALAIGLLFSRFAQNIGKLYFFNLSGSGFGGLLMILLFSRLSPQQTVTFIAILPLSAAFLFYRSRRNLRLYLISTLFILLIVFDFFFPAQLFLSQYKSISKTLNLPESEITAEKKSPHGLLQVIESPFIRYGPGFSLYYQDQINLRRVVFNNGNWVGGFIEVESEPVFDYSTIGLPFKLRDFPQVLSLDSGMGEIVTYSLQKGAEKIVALPGNPVLVDFIREISPEKNTHPYHHSNVEVITNEPYTYLLTTEEKYNLITLPVLDVFGGSTGISALQEKYLLSDKAWQKMWDILDSEGMITISAWIDYPLRYPLRIMSSFVDLLENNKITDPEQHIAAVRNWSMITYTLSKKPINAEEIELVRDFCVFGGFDILHLTSVREEERMQYNILSDDSLLRYSDRIISGDATDFYREYPFKVRPVSENRPYFFQFLKISRLFELAKTYSFSALMYMEVGYLLVFLTLIKVLALAALFIILPLTGKKWGKENKSWTLLYFLALGLGFMMIEIVLIQRFIPYLGTPLYSTAVIITAILFFSGLGSYTSTYLVSPQAKQLVKSDINALFRKRIKLMLSSLILGILLYISFLTPFLNSTIHLNFIWKAILTVLLLSPLSFLMGFPFPLGIKFLHSAGSEDNICWAWAINGSMSVISTVLAMIIAVESGFTMVMLSAFVCYSLALLANVMLVSKGG